MALVLLSAGSRPGAAQETVLYSFGATSASDTYPSGPLVFDKSGNLYGTTSGGTSNALGGVFELSPSGGKWTEKELHSFTGFPDVYYPNNGVIIDSNGYLYGTAVDGGSASHGGVFEIQPGGGSANESVFSFCTTQGTGDTCPQGGGPFAGLVFDSKGNLYGTTLYDGANNGGVAFELTPNGNSWTEKVLYNFCSQVNSYNYCQDGSGSTGPLIFDTKGNLYGISSFGGPYNEGQVFELSPQANGTWTEKTLYSFGVNSPDGQSPNAGLVMDASGNLYGTTTAGGASPEGCKNGEESCGTVFELSPQTNETWTEKIIYTFGASSTDGFTPEAPVIFDAQGNLYGTTAYGGTEIANCPYNETWGCGTVFKLAPQKNGTWTETLLHSFPSTSTDGISPQTGVTFDSAGNLYGVTYQGGPLGTEGCPTTGNGFGCGVAYEIAGVTTGATKATMTSPAPGSTLTGTSATFTWTTASGATGYSVWVGSTGAGSNNLYEGGVHDVNSLTVSGLPAGGKTLYVRLWTSDNGTLLYNDYTYTESSSMVKGAITSPAPNSTLAGSSATFSWSVGSSNATGYALWVGTTGVGSANLYEGGVHDVTSLTISNLPTTGVTVYVRLYTSFNGTLEYTDYTYTTAKQAVMTSPTNGSSLAGPSQTFTWAAGGGSVSGYALWVGTTGTGSHNLLEGGFHTTTSATVSGLPTTGVTIYVRLYTNINGNLLYTDYTYTAAKQAVMSSPTNGSTLSGSSQTFTWAAGGSTASGYALWVGTTGAGSHNIYEGGVHNVTSLTVSGLPTTGGTLYVRLYTSFNGTLLYNDYTYKEE